MSLIVLLTDFGTKDGFVGCMKGVIYSINPKVTVVDLSHEVEPFNVLEGALILKAHYSYFPEGSIFLAVVDPGVGSNRLPVVVDAGRYKFVGPMNGIFDLVLKDLRVFKTYRIERFTLPRRNETFHGRDVFAPICAHLSLGTPPEEVGSPVVYQFLLSWEDPKREHDYVEGKIVYFDAFGNAVTNVPCGDYSHCVLGDRILPVVPYFLYQKDKNPGCVCGSFGFMEIFVPMGNAKVELSLEKGQAVKFFPKSTII
ncbi:SAM hydrolase/SAM-dependent halogenase family protein [Thermocrinis minervae]|uniref:Adenosyl-chloride synthase n=1 Tax=Thermocrinis minervae TaxID=381751 RepID=A0A1M6SRG8_9AQUI|nr:SAM-dependent chlorinase/fluorinase [Thermocrinis minervae]SHK47344.1 hypothetical protein SAMN05444391_1139 [Thermocrinis minervae]